MLLVVGGAGRRVVFGVCEPLSEREGERGREGERKRVRERERGRERERECAVHVCVKEGERKSEGLAQKGVQ